MFGRNVVRVVDGTVVERVWVGDQLVGEWTECGSRILMPDVELDRVMGWEVEWDIDCGVLEGEDPSVLDIDPDVLSGSGSVVSGVFQLLQDLDGSPMLVLDEDGTPVEFLRYDAYGGFERVSQVDQSTVSQCVSSAAGGCRSIHGNLIGYKGSLYHGWTNLNEMRHRLYSSDLRQFLSTRSSHQPAAAASRMWALSRSARSGLLDGLQARLRWPSVAERDIAAPCAASRRGWREVRVYGSAGADRQRGRMALRARGVTFNVGSGCAHRRQGRRRGYEKKSCHCSWVQLPASKFLQRRARRNDNRMGRVQHGAIMGVGSGEQGIVSSDGSHLNLDGLARLVVHACPDAFVSLLTFCPRAGRAPARRALRRLDAQSARDARRPDVLYQARFGERWELWVGELQSRAPRWRADRATFAVGLALRQVEEAMLDAPGVVHPVEVRLLERGIHDVSSGNRGFDASSWSGGGTLLGFNVSNRLVEPGPWCAVLEEPRAWPLRAVARYTTADAIAHLMDQLREPMPAMGVDEEDRVRILTLLGVAGRVRFPEDRRFHTAEEATMANETMESTRPWGHLTRDEQRDIFQEARRRWDLSMKEAHAEGHEAGREEGQRTELLGMIELLSGSPPGNDMRSLPVNELRTMVARLAGRDGG